MNHIHSSPSSTRFSEAQTPRDKLQIVATAVTHAKNTTVTKCGRTPYQAVLGHHPSMPGTLLDDRNDLSQWENFCDDTLMVFTEKARIAALEAFADFEASSHVRRAILRQSRVRKEFELGQRIACWRKKALTRPGGRAMRPGYVIGTLVAFDPFSANNLWGSHGGRLKLHAREQCRHAVGFENWLPSAEDPASPPPIFARFPGKGV